MQNIEVKDLSSALVVADYKAARKYFDEGQQVSPYCVPDAILTNLCRNYKTFSNISNPQFREYLEFRVLGLFSCTHLAYYGRGLGVKIFAEYARIVLPAQLLNFYLVGAFTYSQYRLATLDLPQIFNYYRPAFLSGFTLEDYSYQRADRLKESLKRCYADRFLAEHVNSFFDSIQSYETLLVFAKARTFEIIIRKGIKLIDLTKLGEEKLNVLFSDKGLDFYESCKVNLPDLYKYPANKLVLLLSNNARRLIFLMVIDLNYLTLLGTEYLEVLLLDEFVQYFEEKVKASKEKHLPSIPDQSKYPPMYIFLSVATALIEEKTGVAIDFDQLKGRPIARLKRLITPVGLEHIRNKHDPLRLTEYSDEEYAALVRSNVSEPTVVQNGIEDVRAKAAAVLAKKAFIFENNFSALNECDDIGKLECLCKFTYFDVFLLTKIPLSNFLRLPKSIIKLLGKFPETKLFMINRGVAANELLDLDESVLRYLSTHNVETFFKEGYCQAKQLLGVEPDCLPLIFSQNALELLSKKHISFDDLVKLDIQRLTILLSSNAMTTYKNECKPPVAPLCMSLHDLWEFLSLIPDTLSSLTAYAAKTQDTSTATISGLFPNINYSVASQHQVPHK